MNVVRRVPEMTGLEGVEPEQLTLAKVDPDQLDFWTLKERIAQLERAGRPDRRGEGRPVAQDFRPAFDPADALARGDRGVRPGALGPGPAPRHASAWRLGFAYFVADNFSLAMGNVGAYPPFLAAWAPFLLFLLVGETVLIRSEE